MAVDIQGPQTGLTQAPSESPVVEVPLKDRVDTAMAIAYGTHGYAKEDGEPDLDAIADRVYDPVSKAVAHKRTERESVMVTRRQLMALVWPKVVGQSAWADQEDPQVAEGVYNRLDGQIWRMITADSTGLIQTRLNDGGSGNILCRAKTAPRGEDGVYVTRDLACLLDDFSGPQRAAIKKASDRLATNLAMAIDRVPQHARPLHRELTKGLKTALESGLAIAAPALEAANAEAEPDIADDDVVDDDE